LLVAAFALSACGNASHHDATHTEPAVTSSAYSTTEPNAVVAQVGGHAITKAMFTHALAAELKSEGPGAPVPPDFAACIKHLQATSASSRSSRSKSSPAMLKSNCQQQYLTLQRHALEPLISQQWVIGGAAEAGIHVSDGELEQQLKKAVHGQPQAQTERELAMTGRTWADFVRETKVQLLAEGIRRMTTRKTTHITQTQVVRYYNEHKQLFETRKRRDIEIVRAENEAEALKVKREIASGRSFASIIKSHPAVSQPVYSKDGSVPHYEPLLYRQAPLNNAIFAAKPNVLSGPVKITLGYYVFEVKRTYPSRQKALAQVQAHITQELPKLLYKQAFAAFVREWRARWRAKTDCQPSYVVMKCKQFAASGATPPEKEDPYTLD
jgi:foldase protein PrsA